MRYVMRFLFVTIFCAFYLGIVSNSPAAVFRSPSCSLDDVQATVNSAHTGDTVVVPSGASIWENPLVITKCITLQGQGIDKTVISSNFADPYNGLISIKPESSARAVDSLIRITGFTINCAGKTNGIYVYNPSTTPVTKVRIDHNKIMNAGGTSAGRGIYIIGTVYGVADNNIIDNCRHGMDSEGHSSGIPQWENLSRSFGSANNFYFEDNTISVGPSSSGVFFAGGHGGRYVARYNTLINNYNGNIFPVFDMHGNQPDDICAMMVNEIYGNDVDFGSHGGRITDQRGSMLLVFLNRIHYGGDTPNMHIREEFLDSNYPRGNSFTMHVTQSYYWGNYINGSPNIEVVVSSNQYEDTYDLTENVDFWLPKSPFDGTSGVGFGPLSLLPDT